MQMKVKTGITVLKERYIDTLAGKKVAVLCHSASVDENFVHIVDILVGNKIDLRKIFAPEHGFFADAQDQIGVSGARHPKFGIEIVSLYGATAESLEPKPHDLRDIDAVVIDLQDVGARYYTFVWTAALVMRACAKVGVEVLVLDRPNPLNGVDIEGPIQEDDYLSFVGLYNLPIRHSLTIAEIMLYVIELLQLDVEIKVIKCENWNRAHFHHDTGLGWTMPSPNMPTPDTAIVYPGMCLLEATNLSEGRGTTRPFEIFGAPFIDPFAFCDTLDSFALPGVAFRPLYYTPTFNKFAGAQCGGAQIHVVDRNVFEPVLCGFAIVKAAIELCGDRFHFKNPPYEYEFRKLPFDILTGSPKWREMLVARAPIEDYRSMFKSACEGFLKVLDDLKIY
jgi:uncharacterized protein YbbC (DUF1343 family)